MADVEVNTKPRINEKVKEPPMFKIIYLNDNQTSIDFVIQSLITHFSYTETTAEDIAVNIHQEGAATVAVLPYEIAEQKGIEITVEARANNYPLQIKLEPEEG